MFKWLANEYIRVEMLKISDFCDFIFSNIGSMGTSEGNLRRLPARGKKVIETFFLSKFLPASKHPSFRKFIENKFLHNFKN